MTYICEQESKDLFDIDLNVSEVEVIESTNISATCFSCFSCYGCTQ